MHTSSRDGRKGNPLPFDEVDFHAAIAANPEQAQEVRDGNDKAIGWFVGQIMKATQGKANPQMVNTLIKGKLSG